MLLGSPLVDYQVSVRFSFQGPRQLLLASSFDWAASALGSRTLGLSRRPVNSFFEVAVLFFPPTALLSLCVVGGALPIRSEEGDQLIFVVDRSFLTPVRRLANQILNMSSRSYPRETIAVLAPDSFRAAEDIFCGATGQSLCCECCRFFVERAGCRGVWLSSSRAQLFTPGSVWPSSLEVQ